MRRAATAPLFSARTFATSKKKTKAMSAFKSVSDTEISKAMQKGAALRRVWQLQNVTTKTYADLTVMDFAEALSEIREHINRHGSASMAWLHLLLSKVTTKEEADDAVPKILVQYQASGQALSATTAGTLVSMSIRTGSDTALRVLHDSTKYRIWPTEGQLLLLLAYYAKLGNLESARLLTHRVAREKAIDTATPQWTLKCYRALANAKERKAEEAKWVWALADRALASSSGEMLTRSHINVLLKCCVVTGDVTRVDALKARLTQPNESSAKLLQQLASLTPASAAAAGAAASAGSPAQSAAAAKQ